MTWKTKTEQKSVMQTANESGEFFDNFGEEPEKDDIRAVSEEESYDKEEDEETEGEVEEPEAPEETDGEIPVSDDQQGEGEDTEESDDEEEEEVAESESEEKFDPSLLSVLGLTEESAKDHFKSPEALLSFVQRMDRNYLELGRSQQAVQQPPQQSTQDIVQDVNRHVPGDEKPARKEFVMPPPPDGKEWDPGVVELFKQMFEENQRRFDGYEESLENQRQFFSELERQRTEQFQQSYVREVDEFIDSLDDEWSGLFGKGSGYALDPNGFHVINRRALDSAAMQIAAGMKTQGIAVPSKSELLRRALPLAFPQEQEKDTERKVVKKIAARRKQMTSKPTRKSRRVNKSGEQRAIEYNRKWFKEHGLGVGQTSEFDGVI